MMLSSLSRFNKETMEEAAAANSQWGRMSFFKRVSCPRAFRAASVILDIKNDEVEEVEGERRN